jgi:ferredoxin
MSRREFLGIPRPKNNGVLILDKERCTGCGLCAIDCQTKALTLSQIGEKDTYQLLFRQEICDACGVCEKSCPENCLRMVDQEPEKKKVEKESEVIFEGNISRCLECGTPLYPQAMVERLESKILITKKNTWPFHLCPSCRMKTQFKNGMIKNKG